MKDVRRNIQTAYSLYLANKDEPRRIVIGLIRLELNLSGFEALNLYKLSMVKYLQEQRKIAASSTAEDKALLERIGALSDTEQKILVDLIFTSRTVKEIAKDLGLNSKKLRAIARRAFIKLVEV